MKNFKLTIEMLPKGAWNNDFSKTLPKKEWDIVRNNCYKRAINRKPIADWFREQWHRLRYGTRLSQQEEKKSRGFKL